MRDNKEQIEEFRWEFLLLQTIRVNGSVSLIVDETHNFVNISVKMREYRNQGYIDGDMTQMVLTKTGVDYFNRLSARLGKRGLYKYMMTDVLHRIPVDDNDIYVPDK